MCPRPRSNYSNHVTFRLRSCSCLTWVKNMVLFVRGNREIWNAVAVESLLPDLKSSADGCSNQKGELCVNWSEEKRASHITMQSGLKACAAAAKLFYKKVALSEYWLGTTFWVAFTVLCFLYVQSLVVGLSRSCKLDGRWNYFYKFEHISLHKFKFERSSLSVLLVLAVDQQICSKLIKFSVVWGVTTLSMYCKHGRKIVHISFITCVFIDLIWFPCKNFCEIKSE